MVTPPHGCINRCPRGTSVPCIRRRQRHAVRPLDVSRLRASAQRSVPGGNGSIFALKEWSINISAILDGKQQVLLRRGGIREGAFKCSDQNQFVLFPTGYHTDPELCKPGTATPYHQGLEWDPKHADSIPICGVAKAEDQFTTMNADVFYMLEDLHIWTDSFYAKRLERRTSQPITVILLRAWRFKEPVILPQADSHWGCFSWLTLEADSFVDAIRSADLVHPAISNKTASDVFAKAKAVCARSDTQQR
eukprot:jgi/Ulvmu1/5408/UM022_0203.1